MMRKPRNPAQVRQSTVVASALRSTDPLICDISARAEDARDFNDSISSRTVCIRPGSTFTPSWIPLTAVATSSHVATATCGVFAAAEGGPRTVVLNSRMFSGKLTGGTFFACSTRNAAVESAPLLKVSASFPTTWLMRMSRTCFHCSSASTSTWLIWGCISLTTASTRGWMYLLPMEDPVCCRLVMIESTLDCTDAGILSMDEIAAALLPIEEMNLDPPAASSWSNTTAKFFCTTVAADDVRSFASGDDAAVVAAFMAA